MNPLRHLAVLLFLAWICLDAAVACTPRTDPSVPAGTRSVCTVGLVLGQTALLCAWLVWSPQRLYWRVGGTLAAVYGMAQWASSSAGEAPVGDRWFTLLLIYATAIALPLFALCIAGWRLPVASGAPSGSHRSRHQFTIASLLSLTTAVAVLLAARQFTGVPGKPLLRVVAFCLAAAACSLVTMGASGRGRGPLAAVLIGLTCPVVALLLARTGIPPAGAASLLALTFVQAGSLGVSLLVLRIAGYRLRRDSCPSCPSRDPCSLGLRPERIGTAS